MDKTNDVNYREIPWQETGVILMAVKHGARRLRLLNRLTKYLKVWDHLLCIIVLYKYCIIFISDISRPENIHHVKRQAQEKWGETSSNNCGASRPRQISWSKFVGFQEVTNFARVLPVSWKQTVLVVIWNYAQTQDSDNISVAPMEMRCFFLSADFIIPLLVLIRGINNLLFQTEMEPPAGRSDVCICLD